MIKDPAHPFAIMKNPQYLDTSTATN